MLDLQDKAKEAAGKEAVQLIQEGMIVGIGTGTTAAYFIKHLIKRCQAGLSIQAIPTSERSLELLAGHIPIADINKIPYLDMTVDGADEIDWEKRMIKGGGGALLREKLVASFSREVVIIIDSSKRVDSLGNFPLPVEIVTFAYVSILRRLEGMGYAAVLRRDKSGEIFLTDGGHYIADIHFEKPPHNLAEDQEKIRAVVGVVETGFFAHLAGRVITGYPDGKVEIQK